MARYQIIEWDERYEVDEKGGIWAPGKGKRNGPLRFIRHKVHGKSQGLGWRRLIQVAGMREAPAIFGIFAKLLEVSGDDVCENRGVFQDDTECPLSFVLGLDDRDIKNALSVLCQIGWIKLIDGTPENFGKSPEIQDSRGNPNQFSSVQCSSVQVNEDTTTTARASDFSDNCRSCIATWNALADRDHQCPAEGFPAIDLAFSALVNDFPPIEFDEIRGCMENYRLALTHKDSQAYQWSLGEFLRRDTIAKFRPGRFNLSGYDKTRFQGRQRDGPQQETAEDLAARLKAKGYLQT